MEIKNNLNIGVNDKKGVIMETKTIIFDMDGVLVDSEPVYLQAFQAFLEEMVVRSIRKF